MKIKGRRSWTGDEKVQILRQYNKSGLTMWAFAKKIGLSSTALYRWSRELKAVTADEKPQSLVPVRVKTATLDPECKHFEVMLKTGRVIRVNQGFDERALQRLIEVLEQC